MPDSQPGTGKTQDETQEAALKNLYGICHGNVYLKKFVKD